MSMLVMNSATCCIHSVWGEQNSLVNDSVRQWAGLTTHNYHHIRTSHTVCVYVWQAACQQTTDTAASHRCGAEHRRSATMMWVEQQQHTWLIESQLISHLDDMTSCTASECHYLLNSSVFCQLNSTWTCKLWRCWGCFTTMTLSHLFDITQVSHLTELYINQSYTK